MKNIRKTLGIIGLSLTAIISGCEPKDITYNEVAEKEFPLGSPVVIDVIDKNGTLKTSEGLRAETSLTSYEDDYQTDVVLEVARDAINYHLNIHPNQNIEGETFNLLGNQIKVERVGEHSTIIASFNNKELEVFIDGDAFIGEDPSDPNWVWDIDTSNGETYIGIENDFVINDNTDEPPKVGDCIELPNNYAEICLDDLVGDKPHQAKYETYFIEYNNSADLSDAMSTLTSKPAIFIHTIETGRNPKKNIKLNPGVSTNKIWVTGDGEVYYSNGKNQVEYWKNIQDSVFGKINNEDLRLSIAPSKENNGIDVMIEPTTDTKSSLSINFGIKDGEINSLGNTQSNEEASELTYRFDGNVSYIGTKDEHHRTSYGIIVRNPKRKSSFDKVILDIPKRQIKALVKVYSEN